jgi:hypothetical protein
MQKTLMVIKKTEKDICENKTTGQSGRLSLVKNLYKRMPTINAMSNTLM